METINQFDPVLLSKAENEFLLSAVGLPPVVAAGQIKGTVNPKAVLPIIQRVFELEQLKKHNGESWVGVAAIKQAIQTYLDVDAKWAADRKKTRRAPRYPSLFSFDGKGRPHLSGPGSDSGRVRTYFDAQGNRVPFAIDLLGKEDLPWSPPGFSAAAEITIGIKDNSEANRLECLLCGHTESYRSDSRSSHNAARARMSKHLRKSETRKEEHLEVYTNEFGSSNDAQIR